METTAHEVRVLDARAGNPGGRWPVGSVDVPEPVRRVCDADTNHRSTRFWVKAETSRSGTSRSTSWTRTGRSSPSSRAASHQTRRSCAPRLRRRSRPQSSSAFLQSSLKVALQAGEFQPRGTDRPRVFTPPPPGHARTRPVPENPLRSVDGCRRRGRIPANHSYVLRTERSVAAMTLAPGTRLGSYGILAPLGAGGRAFAHGRITNELRRGLAGAQERIR